MEVHHHGHVHERKKWKEYVFQFLMLFLAVFLGFLAENKREKGVEKHVEREYIESLAVDLRNDYKLALRLEYSVFQQTKKIDTLQEILFLDVNNHPKRDSLTRVCYKLSPFIQTFYSEYFVERTMSQLLSSGSMRLIRNQDVADSIMNYHGQIKFLDVQKQLYINAVKTVVDGMYEVYDITYLKSIFSDNVFRYLDPDVVDCRLEPATTAQLKKFISILETLKVVAFTYKNQLEDMKARSRRLYEYLKEEYHLAE